MIYDNSVNAFQYFDGTVWKKIGGIDYISFSATGNSFIGVNAGISNTTGRYNTVLGSSALYSNMTGFDNVAIGFRTLYTNNGNENTAVGSRALFSNVAGFHNIAIGYNTMYDNTTGYSNVAVGRSTLANNTIGHANVAVGSAAMAYNTVGYQNVAIGNTAMGSNTTGLSNTAVGWGALGANTIGSYNVAYGRRALTDNTTGFLNTAIGYEAFLNGTNYNNSTAIGYNTHPTDSDQVRLGNSSITSIGGYANWSNVSDARFKRQIQSDVPGLAFISLLNPVTYQMDMEAIAKFHQTPDKLRLDDSEKKKSTIRYTGFLAQDVEKAAASIGYNFSGIDKPQHNKGNYSLRYAEFVVPLVKAVQELEAENKTLRAQHADLEARLGKIEALLRQRAE